MTLNLQWYGQLQNLYTIWTFYYVVLVLDGSPVNWKQATVYQRWKQQTARIYLFSTMQLNNFTHRLYLQSEKVLTLIKFVQDSVNNKKSYLSHTQGVENDASARPPNVSSSWPLTS